MKSFRNQNEAGRVLAQRLNAYANRPDDVTVVALPPSMPIAYEVAHLLNAPLDVFVLREVRHPDYAEYAIGAVATGGVRLIYDAVVHALGLQKSDVAEIAAREQQELSRLERLYRGERPFHALRGRTAILVDAGLAGVETLRAALKALESHHHPARLVAAVAAAPPQTCDALRAYANDVVCALTPKSAHSARQLYEELEEPSAAEVADFLERAKVSMRAPRGGDATDPKPRHGRHA
jgi:putative phosphoribosyl transferase